jgi:glycosyltransferase involved in cell wall biosynthesis
MQKEISFSIITPAYNAVKNIPRTFKSVMAQQQVEFEYIIVDAMSTDGSLDLYQLWDGKYKNFNFIYEKDNGIYDAMNKGVKLSQKKFCVFLGAGDVFAESNTLFKIQETLINKKADIIYGYVFFKNNQGKVKEYKRIINQFYPILADTISHQAILAKRKCLLNYPFDLKYKIASDQDWIMHMYKLGKVFEFINIPISIYDTEGISSTEQGYKIGQYELKLIQKQYYPFYYYIHLLLKKINCIFKYKRI